MYKKAVWGFSNIQKLLELSSELPVEVLFVVILKNTFYLVPFYCGWYWTYTDFMPDWKIRFLHHRNLLCACSPDFFTPVYSLFFQGMDDGDKSLDVAALWQKMVWQVCAIGVSRKMEFTGKSAIALMTAVMALQPFNQSFLRS